MANWSLQARQETIRARLYWLHHNAQLQRKALHPYHSRQLQSALHGHTMRKRPSNWCCPRSVTLLSSSQRNTTYSIFWSWHSFYRWSLQTILCPNVHNTGTSLPLAAKKLQKQRQHHTMKNALCMLREDRNCEWTDILEFVTSSMNATINSTTGVSPHYAITGRHPNIGLLKVLSKELTSDDPRAYGMQINDQLRQVHYRVTLANDEADHKLEASLNHFIYKDPIRVGNKVLLHRLQSTIAQSSNLPWIGEFKVIKTNDVMSQVQDENGDIA